MTYENAERTMILIGHDIKLSDDLRRMSAEFELRLPGEIELYELVNSVAHEWTNEKSTKVKANQELISQLVRNIKGIPRLDAQRLIRKAIFDDGAIEESDLENVMRAKSELVNLGGIVSFDYDTAQFADVAGLEKLKSWLEARKPFFLSEKNGSLDPPKGILLLGVQGCGKSLAAKAVAGMWKLPLLRLDFGALYNKYIGETEKNLLSSLKSAEAMSPCVLWLDEIEKGLSTSDSDAGTSKRILGSFLTWMSERKKNVFVVATANDIQELPAELVRKGRFDEIFFVDLPDLETRQEIFKIHFKRRDLDPDQFDIDKLAIAAAGFSGAEIEQSIVAALYTAHAKEEETNTKARIN